MIGKFLHVGFESTDLTYEEQNNGWVERKYVKEVS